MTNEMQGGRNENLPKHLSLLQFTSARANEIKEVKQSLENNSGTKMAFQRLPKHMRRRVMSHNVKRLPKRLHEVHLNQLKKSGMPPKQKRDSRKHRRRPANLLSDYCRRQKTHIWLETHIWHAKRFHMVNKWGYRLPDRPCDKAFRACYRATSNHCLVQDLSYFSCIEIEGPVQIITSKFKTLCEPKCGLSISAAAYIRGNREGQTVLFSTTNGVRQAIGTVHFHWKPIIASESQLLRTLWLWVHPAYYTEVKGLLQNTFSNSQIHIVELKNSLNRFRLTGPLSYPVLFNAIKLANLTNVNSNWFKEYLASSRNSEIYLNQSKYWNNLQSVTSASELSPNHILSLTVVDPRFNLPKTKQKATLPLHETANYIEPPQYAAIGQIWDLHTRNDVRNEKPSNADIAKLRSELLVPGSDIDKPGSAIPILLIQQPGNRNSNIGYSSGWDIIFPSGWGNTFWISLIMCGGRAGGLQEFKSIEFECGKPNFLAPDTKAGMDDEEKESEIYKQQYFNLPPNKRPNYIKLGITEPFKCNWRALVQEWSLLKTSNFVVLRDKSLLLALQEMLTTKSKSLDSFDFNTNCIIPIRIKLEKKGVIKKFARICLPHSRDLVGKSVAVEPLKFDDLQSARKEMRLKHKLLIRQMRRKRKTNEDCQTNVKSVLDYRKQMEELWLPKETKNINSAGRKIIGFVTMGGFSFTQACCCSVGYIAAGGIKPLLSNFKNKLLVRNINSRQYQIGRIQIAV